MLRSPGRGCDMTGTTIPTYTKLLPFADSETKGIDWRLFMYSLISLVGPCPRFVPNLFNMPDSETDILTHFAALDELIQLIYQGSHKFVVLSSVDDVSWTIHLGLNGDDGRWWRGRWTERDIRGFVVSKKSRRVSRRRPIFETGQ